MTVNVSIADLDVAILWLENYEENQPGDPVAASCKRVAEWLDKEIKHRHAMTAIRNIMNQTGCSFKAAKKALDKACQKK